MTYALSIMEYCKTVKRKGYAHDFFIWIVVHTGTKLGCKMYETRHKLRYATIKKKEELNPLNNDPFWL